MSSTADQTLATLAALLSNHLPAESIPESLWPTLISTAVYQNVSPLLLYTIKQKGCAEQLAPWLDPLVQQARTVGVRYAFLKTTQQMANAVLAEASIPAIWLKGIALAETLYPQGMLRPHV